MNDLSCKILFDIIAKDTTRLNYESYFKENKQLSEYEKIINFDKAIEYLECNRYITFLYDNHKKNDYVNGKISTLSIEGVRIEPKGSLVV